MKRRIASLPNRFRPFVRHRDTLPRTFMLTGPRGVGKTTFLLHHANKHLETQQKRILYLSADNPPFGAEGLYEIVASKFLAGYFGVIIDEVHFAKDWSIHLKALYDDFPNHILWISDSSFLCLRTEKNDFPPRFNPPCTPSLFSANSSTLKQAQNIPCITHSTQVKNFLYNHLPMFFLRLEHIGTPEPSLLLRR